MIKKSILLIVVIIFIAVKQSLNALNIEYTEFTLDNGLHVILHQDKSTPIVAVTLMYHIGSKDEDPERTGFAHFFEHLMFEGTKHIDRGEYNTLVQNAGGTLNAYTSFDKTYYHQILPSNQLELALWMESERMLNLIIDELGVETQREVIKEEKRQILDNQPYGSILQQTFATAFTVHPYQWVPIGDEQYIDEASIEEFKAFYEMYYVPDNAVLSIAGDLDIKNTRQLVEKYFGDIPKGTVEKRRPDVVEPPRTREKRDTVYDNIQLPAVIMAYHIPEEGSKDHYAMSMLATLLSEGRSSRFVREIVDEQELAIQAGAFPLALEDPGLFICFGIVNMGVKPDQLENAIEKEIAKVQNDLISERELQRLKNQVQNSFVSRNARVRGVAESLANYHLFYGDAGLINTEINKYLAVTPEDLKRVANKYLVDTNRVVLYYLPKSEKIQ